MLLFPSIAKTITRTTTTTKVVETGKVPVVANTSLCEWMFQFMKQRFLITQTEYSQKQNMQNTEKGPVEYIVRG